MAGSQRGDLPAVHRAVIERAFVAQTPKMQWPLTWLFTVLRTSGADLIGGWDDLYRERRVSAGEARCGKLYREIGQDFWSRRQPNGFSLEAVDWISTEHFDRRLRLAFMIGSNPKTDDRLAKLWIILRSMRRPAALSKRPAMKMMRLSF